MLNAMLLVAALAVADHPRVGPPEPTPDGFAPDPTWKPMGQELWFDPVHRRLVLRATVTLREGYLEHLLCRERTKEHESILATAAEPRLIHTGLLLTGAEAGHPVRFQPEFEPPTGTPIAIELQWLADGKTQHARARDWVQNERAKKPLDRDWVFAGSELYKDPETGQVHYTANAGDLVTVANFPNAILDLPFASTSNDADRSFVAYTERIPARGTPVTVFLRPASKPSRPATKR